MNPVCISGSGPGQSAGVRHSADIGLSKEEEPSMKPINRRQFLKRASTGAAVFTGGPSLLRSSVLGRAGHIAPNDKILIGCIGAGPQGADDLRYFLRNDNARVVAVCDVKEDRIARVKKSVDGNYQSTDCATYRDFRELLSRRDIDAVLIATPDHWHVPIALQAVRAGKDLYVEKPLGLSVEQDLILQKEISNSKRVFQFGTQQRSSRNFRHACELVRNGRIGELRTIKVWSPASSPGGPDTPLPVPPGIDYEMWLGPAPYTPYTEYKCSDLSSKKTWWYTSDYALGFIAGWGIHPMDIALWGAGGKVKGPVEIEGSGVFPAEGACNTATDWDIEIRFAGGLKIEFSGIENVLNNTSPEGQKAVDRWSKLYSAATSHGTVFEGSEGWVHVNRQGIAAKPSSLLTSGIGSDEDHLTVSEDHGGNFLECIRSRGRTVSDIDESVASDLIIHLSEIAIRLKHKVHFDLERNGFVDDPQADKMLTRALRSPWSL
jgi:predicted dehydrogenase